MEGGISNNTKDSLHISLILQLRTRAASLTQHELSHSDSADAETPKSCFVRAAGEDTAQTT